MTTEYIYKYIDKATNKPVYIGRTKNLNQRIKQHSNEEKFKGREFKIEYIQVENRAESEALETHFINLYNTHLEGLNVSKGGWGTLQGIEEIDFEWIPLGCRIPVYTVSKINYEGRKQFAFVVSNGNDVVWMDEKMMADTFSKVEAKRMAQKYGGIVEKH